LHVVPIATIHAAAGDPDRLDRVLPRIQIGRGGEPADIAPAIAWLLGPPW